MSKTMYDLLRERGHNFRSKVTGRRYGIELEVEGGNLPRENDLGRWNMHRDGSLRGVPECAEYTTGACSLLEVKQALAEMEGAMKKRETTEHESVRTSVHVHANVQDLTPSQLASVFTTYLIVEGSLYSVCGDHRDGNVFCNPLLNSTTVVSAIAESLAILHNDHPKAKIPNTLYDTNTKYTALNPRPLVRGDDAGAFGTIEFRAHEGTIDTKRIWKWVSIINNIISYSITKTPYQVLQDFSSKSIPDFFGDVFGNLVEFISISEKRAWAGVDTAHIITNATNWDNIAPPKPKPQPKSQQKEDFNWDRPVARFNQPEGTANEDILSYCLRINRALAAA